MPVETVTWLLSTLPDCSVQHVIYEGLGAKSDDEILAFAIVNSLTVITFDEDFTDARKRPSYHSGIIRLRIYPTTIEQIVPCLERVLREIGESDLTDRVLIVDERRTRFL